MSEDELFSLPLEEFIAARDTLAKETRKAGDKDAALTAGRDAMKQLDKAASKGVIHANQAANRKSSIAKKAASL